MIIGAEDQTELIVTGNSGFERQEPQQERQLLLGEQRNPYLAIGAIEHSAERQKQNRVQQIR